MSRQKKLQKLKRRRERALSARPWDAPEKWKQQPVQDPPPGYASYTVTDEPMPDAEGGGETLEQILGNEGLERLHGLVKENPHAAIAELTPLLEAHPDIPVIYNWLQSAYSLAGNAQKSEELIHRLYQRHPNYLFGRVAYAQLLLRRKEIKKAAEVFNHTWNLKAHYPQRSEFHITEFVAFASIYILYHFHTGDMRAVDAMFQAMKGIAPDSEVTQEIAGLLSSPDVAAIRLVAKALLGSKRRRR